MEALTGKGQRFIATARPSDLPPLEPTTRITRPIIGSAPGPLPFQRIVHALSRRRGLILAMMLLGGGGVAIVGLIMSPAYTATTQIVVDRASEGSSGTSQASQAIDDAAIDTHLAVLSSDAHLRRVASALLLAHEEGVAAGNQPDSWLHRVQDGLGAAWSFITQPFKRSSDSQSPDSNESALAQQLKRSVKIGQERRSRVLSVVATDSDPRRAAEIANTVAHVYIEDTAQRKRTDAEQLVVWLAKRVPEMRLEVARAEEELQAYRLLHGATVDGTPDVTGQQIAQLARQLALAKSDFAATQQRLNRFNDLRQRGAPTAALADALGSASLAEFAHSEATPATVGQEPQPEARREADRVTEQAIDQALSQVETDGRILQAQARSIEERLQSLKAAATETAASMSGLRALERQAAAVAQLYDALLSRQQQANEQVQLIQPDVRVMASAWPPERPSSIHPAFLIPPGVMVFGIMGVLLALGIDRLDHTLRSTDEAAEALGVPCLGQVPQVTLRHAKRIEDLLRQKPQSIYARSIRSLLISVLPRGSGSFASKIILVSSALPGEGKTTVARSLVLSAARLRLRVLLIDLGEPSGLPERDIVTMARAAAPGVDLVDVLSRGRPIAEAVEHLPELGVDYIPPPRLDGNLLHFLANPQVPHWLDQFRETYDFIVIDGPAAVDRLEASFLAGWADQVLLVVRWAQTGREMAQSALRLVGGAPGADADGAPRVASVLTWVDTERDAGFHFKDIRGFKSWRRS
ncbi:tyrosine-protein kinase Wzc [Bosea sp. BIWAKO-01]|nr:tyrosine-protein kinase Wzc [Bosea sp. BIWAKO-01]